MKALVFIEMKDGVPIKNSLELITVATAIEADVSAVRVREAKGTLYEDSVTEAIVNKAKGFDVIFFAATQLGKTVVPRVAARLGGASVNDVIALKKDGNMICVTRPIFGGTVLENLQIQVLPAVMSVRGGSFSPSQTVPETEILDGNVDVRTRVTEIIDEVDEAVNLEDASVIVTGGRGMGSEAEFALCVQLADVLGGVVGATRPAIENGWIGRTHQVGQSGKIVTPNLYIACGVSGATQHLSGMAGSKYIVAINKDPNAPIFSVADIGIVGDVKSILPLMIEEVKRRIT